MTEAELQYYEAMENLFQQPGWKLLMDDIAGWKDAISSQWRTATPESLRFAQGRYDGMDQIHTFESTLATIKATAEQDALDASIP